MISKWIICRKIILFLKELLESEWKVRSLILPHSINKQKLIFLYY